MQARFDDQQNRAESTTDRGTIQTRSTSGCGDRSLRGRKRREEAMMGQFVVSNLFHRPVRTLIGVLAVAVEVMLVITIVGLTSGMLQETAKRIEGIGADILIQPSGTTVFIDRKSTR